MKTKTILIVVVVVILIVLVGIGVLFWWGSRKVKDIIFGTEVVEKIKEKAEEEGYEISFGEEEEASEGEIYGNPLPQYSNMVKMMEEKEKATGNFVAQYMIEGKNKTSEIKSFYKEELPKQGWSLDDESMMGGQYFLKFSKEGASLNVVTAFSADTTNLTLVYEAAEKKENPYDKAEEVIPMADICVVFDNNFRPILEEIFDGNVKLIDTASGDLMELEYITNRQITQEDARDIKNSLQDKDYVMEGSDSSSEKYHFDFSKTMEGKEYNDIDIEIYLTDEGKNRQKVRFEVWL